MKKQILTLALATLFSAAYSQQSLKKLISGQRGMSNHFTLLEEGDQVMFNSKQARDVLSLDPSSDLVLQNAETDNLGFIHYRYSQTYNNIPIENSMCVAHVKNGKLTALSGEIITEFDNALKQRQSTTVSARQAVANAIRYVNAQKYAWQNAEMERWLKAHKSNTKATYFPSAKLVWFGDGESITSQNLRAAWKINVYAILPLSSAYYFIDAQTGDVLGKNDRILFTDAIGTANTAYSGKRTIHSDKNGSVYRLRDYTKGQGILTLNNEWWLYSSDFTSPTANWNLTGTNQAAMDAHYGVSQTYSFYLANFNRNSYDNNGAILQSNVNYPLIDDNAFWEPESATMNFCKSSNPVDYPAGVTSIDITAHELTHAVTQVTSGLVYSKESGAINESMSDIMGKSVQFWAKPSDTSWRLSNDMDWIIRNMANPNQQGHPDTYKGTYWNATSTDNYGVHTNSGVGNYMFYLLVTGGSGTNDLGNAYTVKGIGLQKADQIIYRTNTAYLTPTSQYADWRIACINAAKDLYAADTSLLASVINAWYAVGIGKAAGDLSCDKPTGLTITAITDTSATVSWTATDALRYTLNWKSTSSPAWITVANVPGTAYNLTGLTPSTPYQFQVRGTCISAKSKYSKTALFTTADTGSNFVYCTSAATSSLWEYIDKVTLKNISNTSGSNNGYGDFTGLTANLTKGVAHKIKLTPGFLLFTYSEYWSVYIDYNQDKDFADPGERVATGYGTAEISKSFIVPVTAKTGITQLRVQMTDAGTSSNDPCATFANGEVEDYTVKILAASPVAPVSSFDLVKESMETGIKISPNPVAGFAATITYKVAKKGKVTLVLMDYFGRTVETIVPGDKAAGTYMFNLNNMKRLQPGTYIIAILHDNVLAGKTRFIVAK